MKKLTELRIEKNVLLSEMDQHGVNQILSLPQDMAVHILNDLVTPMEAIDPNFGATSGILHHEKVYCRVDNIADLQKKVE